MKPARLFQLMLRWNSVWEGCPRGVFCLHWVLMDKDERGTGYRDQDRVRVITMLWGHFSGSWSLDSKDQMQSQEELRLKHHQGRTRSVKKQCTMIRSLDFIPLPDNRETFRVLIRWGTLAQNKIHLLIWIPKATKLWEGRDCYEVVIKPERGRWFCWMEKKEGGTNWKRRQ